MRRVLFAAGLLGCCAVLAIGIAWRRFSSTILFSTSSPKAHNRIEISQSRPFPFTERVVFLNAYRDGKPIVERKLLYTGDFLDGDFRELYPNPRFHEESIYELGSIGQDGTEAEGTGEVRILNASPRDISYLLIETGWHKLVLLDVKAGTTMGVPFRYGRSVSVQGRFEDRYESFAAAVAVDDEAARNGERLFLVSIDERTAVIQSPGAGLRPARCCVPDRPDPDHEGSY